MNKSVLLISALGFVASSAFAQAANVVTSCSDNQFSLTANFGSSASCTYNEKLTVNGIESFEEISFSGDFSRQIALQEGDNATVTSTFQCSTPNGSFSSARSNSTVDGCSGESQAGPTPIPDPDPTPEPPIDEFDPAALQEFQLELADILTLAASQVSSIQSRAARFETRNPRFAARIISTGIERLQIITDSRVNSVVNRFVSQIEPSEFLDALEQFNNEFDSIIDIQ